MKKYPEILIIIVLVVWCICIGIINLNDSNDSTVPPVSEWKDVFDTDCVSCGKNIHFEPYDKEHYYIECLCGALYRKNWKESNYRN